MAIILKGAPVAAALSEGYRAQAGRLRARGITPQLAILRVGERADDLAYESGAKKRCQSIGIEVRSVVLPQNAAQAELVAEMEKLSGDAGVHGVLMFRPLPKTLDERAVCAALNPRKDVDGITAGSMARVYSGSGAGFPPCTAQSVMEILKYYGIGTAGRRAVVIGRSLVIGRPVAMLLMEANATVTICHTQTADMPALTRQADIVVAAAGKAEAVTAEYFSHGQIVIDVGINYSEAKRRLVGDVDFENVEPLAAAISPVPSGVGSVTAALLCGHVLEAAERQSV